MSILLMEIITSMRGIITIIIQIVIDSKGRNISSSMKSYRSHLIFHLSRYSSNCQNNNSNGSCNFSKKNMNNSTSISSNKQILFRRQVMQITRKIMKIMSKLTINHITQRRRKKAMHKLDCSYKHMYLIIPII